MSESSVKTLEITPEVKTPAKARSTSIPVQPTKILPHQRTNLFFIRVAILLASVVLVFATCLFIAGLHIFKLFKKIKLLDPFHDSRRHPLNDPHALRS